MKREDLNEWKDSMETAGVVLQEVIDDYVVRFVGYARDNAAPGDETLRTAEFILKKIAEARRDLLRLFEIPDSEQE